MKVEKLEQDKKQSEICSEQALVEKLRGLPFVPRTYDLGVIKSTEKKKYSAMIMDLLGRSLKAQL